MASRSGADPGARRVSSWQDRSYAAVWLAAVWLAADCVGAATRGAPLYRPAQGTALPLARVATLTGHVAEVDGKDVTALMPPYEILPGCHVVRTPERWNAVGVSWSGSAQTGMLPFALQMRAGHAYNIEAVTQVETSISGSLDFRAVETDARGEQTGLFPVTKDQAQLDACNGSDGPVQ